jgi:hypothetical protein
MEKFDYYIELLLEGESVKMDGHTYSDFVRYIKAIGGSTFEEFKQRMISEEVTGDKATFPSYIQVTMKIFDEKVVNEVNFKIDNEDILSYEFYVNEEIWIDGPDDYHSLFRWQYNKTTNEVFVNVAWVDDFDLSEDVTYLFDTDSLGEYFKKQENIQDETEQYEEYYQE